MNDATLNIINSTKKWINDFVIANNLCPFAKYGFDENMIDYLYCDSSAPHLILEKFNILIQKMEKDDHISNSFLIINPEISFDELLDVSSILFAFIEELELDEDYQLVDFHPELIFGDVDQDDSSNYINRSPYPMIHILRTEEVENAISKFLGNVDDIPYRNIDKMKQLGTETLDNNLKNYQN